MGIYTCNKSDQIFTSYKIKRNVKMKEENKLFQILCDKNITYRELSRLSGVSESSLNKIANYISDPKQSTMIAIARALKMEVVDIFNFNWEDFDNDRWR